MTIEEAIKFIEDTFGFKCTERIDIETGEKWYEFERTHHGYHHVVIIEDHRWERVSEDFDPVNNPYDVGEWLIFSYTDNSCRDYFGHEIEEQQPLTAPEMYAFLALTKAYEEEESTGWKEEDRND